MDHSRANNNTLAFVDGNVFTLDDNKPRAEAFIINSIGTFAEVGSTAEVTATAKREGIPIRQLHGVFVMPGRFCASIYFHWII